VRSGEDNLGILAAGVAFYALLSIFPGLTALVSLYGLIANPLDIQQLVNSAAAVLPQDALAILNDEMAKLLLARSKLGWGLAVSLLFALWTTNYGTASLISALNVAYEEQEKRGYIRTTLTGLGITAGLVLFGIVTLLLVAVLPAIINWLPVPTGWRHAISFVRWPILAAIVMAALALVYRLGPSRSSPSPGGAPLRWASRGAMIATIAWVVVSYGFSFYVARFSSYDKTYGSLGAVVVLMMWLYLSAYVVLLGAALDAELERRRWPLPALPRA
jgi:membrane protein